VKKPKAPQADSPFWKIWKLRTGAHVAAYKLTRGRLGGKSSGAPALLLEHVGRKSGQHRTNPLICRPDGESLIVIASKGGIEKHPAWYLNLMANPETYVWWQGRKRHVRAREAAGAERDRLWARMVEVYPAYAAYQRRIERQIPVVVLERAG
jgi:deazaflavin-dependent oxidoreductase (nitroreductase family)